MKITRYISATLKNWKDLMWWRNVFLYKIIFPFLFRNNKGIYILKESWNNLIILDACRYDTFKEEFDKRKMKGKLKYIVSRGAETTEFLRENFSKTKYNDIVYITANPFVDKLLRGKLYKIISVWKNGWNDKYQTVLPETMYEYALNVIRKYPDKRLIIHFIQPHSPYPNGTGEFKFGKQLNAMLNGKKFKIRYKLDENSFAGEWPYIGTKSLKVDKLKEGYQQNLELAMPYIEKLIDILPGRTVVTADHGEAFGEKIHPLIPIKIYGHIPEKRISVLIKVPWLVIEPEEKEPPKDIEKELAKNKKKTANYKKETQRIKKSIKKLKSKGKI